MMYSQDLRIEAMNMAIQLHTEREFILTGRVIEDAEAIYDFLNFNDRKISEELDSLMKDR